MLSAALLSMLLPCATAAPMHGRADDEASADDVEDLGVRAERSGERTVTLGVGFRTRRLSLPRRFLDIWFTDRHEKFAEWPLDGTGGLTDEERPFVNGMGYGVELRVTSGNNSGIIFFDWADSNMPAGYWDDADDPPDPFDGDYLDPQPNLGLIMVGADYEFAIEMVKTERTNGKFGLDLAVGGGLGLAVMVGKMDRWVPGERDEPAYELYHGGEPSNSQKSVPVFYPVVDVNLGLNFNFADRAYLRLEGGLHTLLYYGGALGFSF